MKVVLSILLFCSFLLADRDGGPYIGLGYGLSQYDDDNIYKEQKVDDSKPLTIYGGAYINKNFSVELSYVGFNILDDYKVVDDSDIEQSISFSSLNVSTLVHYAFFDDILDVYGKFGVGETSASEAGSSGFAMVFGTGVGVRFNDRLSMKIAYDRYFIKYTKDSVEHDMYIDFIYTALEVQF